MVFNLFKWWLWIKIKNMVTAYLFVPSSRFYTRKQLNSALCNQASRYQENKRLLLFTWAFTFSARNYDISRKWFCKSNKAIITCTVISAWRKWRAYIFCIAVCSQWRTTLVFQFTNITCKMRNVITVMHVSLLLSCSVVSKWAKRFELSLHDT